MLSVDGRSYCLGPATDIGERSHRVPSARQDAAQLFHRAVWAVANCSAAMQRGRDSRALVVETTPVGVDAGAAHAD
eukprot:5639280-Lingulodinium_polyedra.AAC.1